jgi:hypothetical protein
MIASGQGLNSEMQHFFLLEYGMIHLTELILYLKIGATH